MIDLSIIKLLQDSNSNHGVPRHNLDQVLLAPPLSPMRPLRDHQVPAVGGRVVDSHRYIRGKGEAKLLEHSSWVTDTPRPIGSVAVPRGAETKDGDWVARAEGADDEVVHLGGILYSHKQCPISIPGRTGGGEGSFLPWKIGGVDA